MIQLRNAPIDTICRYDGDSYLPFRKHNGFNVYASRDKVNWILNNSRLTNFVYNDFLVTIEDEQMPTGYSATITMEKTMEKTKIEIEGKTYFLNVPVSNLVSAGTISLDTTIKDIKVGDRFKLNNTDTYVVLICSYQELSGFYQGTWLFGGLWNNDFQIYSNPPLKKDEMIKYLNDKGYVKIEK